MPDAATDERFRHPSFWTGRWARALVVALVLLGALRAAWGWSVDRKVRAQWDATRRRGEPTTASEVTLPSPPAGQDAWPVIVRAGGAVVDGASPRLSNLEYTAYPPYGPKWRTLAEKSEAAHGQVFALARKARAFPLARLFDTVDLSLDWRDPGYYRARGVVQVLVDGAQIAETKGNHVEAVERLRDAMHVARALRQDPFMGGQYSTGGVEEIVCHGAFVVGPGLDLRAAGSNGPATRAAVHGLIADLLDQQPAVDAMAAALATDRLFATTLTREGGGPRRVLAPMREGQLLRANEMFASAIAAVRQPDWPAARTALVPHPRRGWTSDEHDGLTALYAGRDADALARALPQHDYWFLFAYPSLERVLEHHYRALAERRAAAAALAAQLFRADHGRCPRSLDELVPTYLPAVPRDPFRTDGGPLGYFVLPRSLPDGGDRPMLSYEYSTVDSKYAPDWREPFYDRIHGKAADGTYTSPYVRQYRDLARFRWPGVPIREIDGNAPAPADEPSPETPDPQPDKPGRPRERE
ncbi:MAG: hypothetical protein ACAI43_10530 [Phycisphaerae bacterium]